MNVMDVVNKRDKVKYAIEYLKQEQGSEAGTVLLTDEEVNLIVKALQESLDYYESFLTNIYIPGK